MLTIHLSLLHTHFDDNGNEDLISTGAIAYNVQHVKNMLSLNQTETKDHSVASP